MTNKVHMFGRKSLDQARLYAQNNPEKELIILTDARGRFAVCSPNTAKELKAQGFKLLASGS